MPVPIKIYSLNEIGGRKNNEDAIWPRKGEANLQDRLFLVCDGVGGNSHGEVASQMACELFGVYFKAHLTSEDQLTPAFVEQAREHVMAHFRDYIALHPEATQMSTTLTLIYLKQDSVFVAWCGDSKIFQVRNGEIIFQSEDHSLVNELVKRGEISAEEALTHPRRNVITRSLQAGPRYSEIQYAEIFDLADNDHFLLCSDGVTEKVTPAILKEILSSTPEDQILETFQDVSHGKTRDNYSMHLLRILLSKKPVENKKPEISAAIPGKKKSSRISSVVAVSILLLLFLGAYWIFTQL